MPVPAAAGPASASAATTSANTAQKRAGSLARLGAERIGRIMPGLADSLFEPSAPPG
jgi:hypothetical protein